MKVSCSQADLSRGLATVSHAVSARSTLPVLANILLTTDNGRLKLSATNLEIGINCWVPAEVSEEGSTTVPARLLTDFISSLPSGQVEMTLSQETHTLSVKAARNAANIKGLDATEFPLIPSAEGGEPPVRIEAATLKSMIDEVAFAAAADDARPVFTGVLVQVGEGKLTFAAADSFRLAVRTTDLASDGHPQGDILVPARTMSELSRILPGDGEVQMIVTPNRSQVLFHTENLDLVSRLIDGQFPNYQQILPKGHTIRAVISTAELRAAAKSVALFARESSNIVRVQLEPAKDGAETGTITLQATAEDLGDNTGVVNAAIDGEQMQIIFNVRYVTDVLNVLDCEEIALELNSAQAPGVIMPVGNDDYTYVIMPMHNIR